MTMQNIPMLTLDTQIQHQRKFLSVGQSMTIDAQLRVPSGDSLHSQSMPLTQIFAHLTALVDHVLPEAKTGDPRHRFFAHNIRGRPIESFARGTHPLPRHSHTKDKKMHQGVEELFFIEGILITDEDSSSDTDNTSEQRTPEFSVRGSRSILQEEPFTYIITSSFDHFEQSQIIYEVNSLSSGALPNPLSLADCVSVITLRSEDSTVKIHQVRLGFEFFKPHFFSSSLGLAPIVHRRFYLEVDAQQINLHVYKDSIRDSVPFAQDGLLGILDTVLENCGLYVGLCRELEEKAEVSVQ